LEDMLIISRLNIIDDPNNEMLISVKKADGQKCERCWHYSTEVGEDANYPTICPRCSEALR
ncbi:MAG: hypothetical protein HZB21_02210, partial [Deltaproteobacteria bacterium]|nr:hypothetical protein [Deltaproteobacteria bacterium]